MKLSEIFPLGFVPRGGNACLHTFPVGGKMFRGHMTDAKPPNVFSKNDENRSDDSTPHFSVIIELVHCRTSWTPQHNESIRSSTLVRLATKSNAAI